MTNFRDIEKIIFDVGEVEYLVLKMLIYIKELELKIEQLEKKINSKD